MQNIVDALQADSIKKSGVERSLAALVEAGEVTRKEFGKTKLYLQCQAKISLPDEETAAAEVSEVETLSKKVEELDAQIARLRGTESGLKHTLTLDAARAELAEVEKDVCEKKAELEALGDPDELPTEEDKRKVEINYYKCRTAWKKRKKTVKNIVDTISENMGKKPAELMEIIGLETDKDVGADLAEFKDIADPSKAKKKGSKPAAKRRRTS